MLGSPRLEDDGRGSIVRRQESRKRRRVSERRRAFSRLAGDSFATSTSGRRTSRAAAPATMELDERDAQSAGQHSRRSDSPALATNDQSKISMKIQFHISPMGQDTEPLILDTSQMVALDEALTEGHHQTHATRKKSATESPVSIGEQIHEKLNRQNTLSTRRRQQLLALHNQTALDHRQRDRLSSMTATGENELAASREPGARSSTITGGMQDEATARFLARQQMRASSSLTSSGGSLAASPPTPSASSLRRPDERHREHIYFKRDGQRFGHEFTLKLAVDKSYRCLLKVRPLIPLQGITIQGHHVSFVDCSLSPGAVGSLSSSAPSIAVNSSWQSISSKPNGTTNHHSTTRPAANQQQQHHQNHHQQQQHHHHRLSHAQTTAITPIRTDQSSLADRRLSSALASPEQGHSLSLATSRHLQQLLLKQQQHNQMMRHFAASHCSPSGSHLGSQLVYMFDWSAARFEVNKNKARTQVQTVLKFKNGEILSLPMQVKFYEPESRQHLNWGSQLHFIDYDCNINNMGQINVERIQYY